MWNLNYRQRSKLAEDLGGCIGTLLGILFTFPVLFWLIWTYFGIGKLFYFLPETFQVIGFWNIFGIYCIVLLIVGTIKRVFA